MRGHATEGPARPKPARRTATPVPAARVDRVGLAPSVDPPPPLLAPDLTPLDLDDHDPAVREHHDDVDLVVLGMVRDPKTGDEYVVRAELISQLSLIHI